MKDPLPKFKSSWRHAIRRKDPTADYLMLATADAKGNPHVRTVLIKTVDADGVGFVTNASGCKVSHFKKHRRVECCVVWPSLMLQVRLSGRVMRMPQKTVDRLWKMRPREAQVLYHLGLKQSQPIPSFDFLKKKVGILAKKWSGKKNIPTSPNYVGYILKPTMIEFLHHSPARLNLRESLQKTSRGWTCKVLAP